MIQGAAKISLTKAHEPKGRLQSLESESLELALLPPAFVRNDERGTFSEIVNGGPWEAVITGTMRCDGVLGNHYHKRTRMYFHLLGGAADAHVIAVDTGERGQARIPAGRGVYLEPGWAHAIHFREESTFLLLKSRAYRGEDPDTYVHDVFRL